MHKIHAPALSRTGRDRGWATMECDVLAAPELQALQSIEPSYTRSIHEPAFSPQQHPDPQIPKPGPGMGEIANAELEARLILCPTLSIPSGATELRQPAGPCTLHLERGLKPLGQFPAEDGPKTFFEGPPTTCACRMHDRQPAVSNDCFPLPTAEADAVHLLLGTRTLLPTVERRVTRHELTAAVVDRGASFSLSNRISNLFL